MKKLLNTAFYYAIAALICGVFYREFTKILGFNTAVNQTTLAYVHTHLFMLGMIFILIVALFSAIYPITSNPRFAKAFLAYNIGVVGATAAFVWRGVYQVLGTELSSAINASISGISGVFHIILTIGLLMILTIIKKEAVEK